MKKQATWGSLGALAAFIVGTTACGGQYLPVGDDNGGRGGAAGAGGSGQSEGGLGSGGRLYTEPTAGDDGLVANGGTPGSGGTTEVCPCTRRSGLSRLCRKGSGEVARATVGEQGAELQIEGAAAVSFPAHTFTAPTEVTLEELEVPPPQPFVDWSPLYRVAPDTLSFQAAATIKLYWTSPAADSYEVPGDLKLFGSTTIDGPYTEVADEYQNAGFNQATLNQPGYYFMGQPKTAAQEVCP